MIRFRGANHRIIDSLRPTPFVGEHHYLMAKWRSKVGHPRGLDAKYFRHKNTKAWKTQSGGWAPGRLRLGPLQPNRRVNNPAIRWKTPNRQLAEIYKRRRKQEAYPFPLLYLWAKRRRKK